MEEQEKATEEDPCHKKMGYPHHTLKSSITYTPIYISTHCNLFMTYILVQEHVTSTTRGE